MAVRLALVGLSFLLLMCDACARRHYTMTVTEVAARPAPRSSGTVRGPVHLRNRDGRAAQQRVAPSSEPLIPTTGDEQPSPQGTQGFSTTAAKPTESTGEQVAGSSPAAEEQSRSQVRHVTDWFSAHGPVLLFGGAIGVAVLVAALMARRRVRL